MKVMKAALLCVLMLALMAISLPAQTSASRITGTVTDSGGAVISGAKVVATGSVLTNYTFIAHHGLIPLQDKSYALVFMLPTNAPGVKFLCRTSYEMTAAVMSSPFDQPLSSRLDENDAVFIMDKVFVPWENVFVYGDVEKANAVYVDAFAKAMQGEGDEEGPAPEPMQDDSKPPKF